MRKTASQVADEILFKVAMSTHYVGAEAIKPSREALAKLKALFEKQIAAMDRTPGKFSPEAVNAGNQAAATAALTR